MAGGHLALKQSRPHTLWWLPGSAAVVVLLLLIGVPFSVLLFSAQEQMMLTDPAAILARPYIRRVIWFSFYQALLSTLLSLLFALPLSLALARRAAFPGRRLLLSLFSLSLILPAVVAVSGIVAVYGRSGWLFELARWLGIDAGFDLYGLTGILLAHLFFNIPLATRVFLQALEAVPDTSWRLGAQLGLRPLDVLRIIEWPALRQQIASVSVLIFSLCFTSFAIVMTLGGGPAATTIEVAIYQAVRFDFDLALAVNLAVIQLVFCALLLLAQLLLPTGSALRFALGNPARRYHRERKVGKLLDFLLILLLSGFIITPLLALLFSGVNSALPDVLLHASTLKATLNTLWVALTSGILSVLIGCLLLVTVRHLQLRTGRVMAGRALELSGMLILLLPPVVLGTGLFITLRPYADVFSLALLLVVLVNAMMGLPFVLRILSEPIVQNARRYDTLCASLAVQGLNRLRLVEWPVLRRPLGLALALACTLSAGDFTVIALFGSERLQTLPLLLYQRMGSYRMQEAAVTALLLLLLCLALFWCLERLVGGRDARVA